ncbi:MAG: hypothetical protein A2147_08310 [Chloroflexi bacterium RBG_16_57_8]|nr:MAG: hypothetical protein A2147_08310 [Chloroflexi bacterium RBG_16_57_8]
MTSFRPLPAHRREIGDLREEIQQRTGKTPQELYEEREKRVRDSIYLRQPDRIPLFVFPDPAAHYGIPHSAAWYDPAAWRRAFIREALDFEPDLTSGTFTTSGETLAALDVKNRLWPGGPLPADYEMQFVESEFMKEDEYDFFLSDPSGFMIRRYLPRMCGSLAPLAKLPPLDLMTNIEGITELFCSPDFRKLARALDKAGREMRRYRLAMGNLQEDLAQLGFPALSHPGGVGVAPFDVLSSFFRGMKGSMLDMYRQPDNVIRACEAILERRIATALPADPKARGNPKRVFMPLWRGDKSFMSKAHFDRFYWPTLKKTMLAAIKLGYVPMPVFEAHFGDRLRCMLELPKGKAVAVVEHMDVVQAKDILGGHTCIIGNVPKSLRYKSPKEVLGYYKDLIAKCAKGGGLMLNISLPYDTPVEKLKDMVRRISEYATY